MLKKKIKNFDIDKISRSGQCFRMNSIEENRYEVIAFGEYLEISQKGDQVIFFCTQKEYKEMWEEYFDLKTDYDAMEAAVDPEDTYLTAAVQCGHGMRILKQDLWEVIVSFIISQQNHIPRIKKCVESLCATFGEKRVNGQGEIYYTFPDARVLAQHELEDYQPCSLGYRGKYIWKTARMVAEGQVDLPEISQMDYEGAKKELMKLCGVGIKVAECICLFALHHIEAFPIDTHIQQMLENHYPKGFPFERYAGFAGVMQQYGFYYELWGEKDTFF